MAKPLVEERRCFQYKIVLRGLLFYFSCMKTKKDPHDGGSLSWSLAHNPLCIRYVTVLKTRSKPFAAGFNQTCSSILFSSNCLEFELAVYTNGINSVRARCTWIFRLVIQCDHDTFCSFGFNTNNR